MMHIFCAALPPAHGCHKAAIALYLL